MTQTPAPAPVPVTPSPAALNLTAAQITAAGAVVVPLYVIPYDPQNPSARKLGVPVIVTAQPPSEVSGEPPAPVLYEFDTGGKAFWADAAKLGDLSGCATHGEVFTQYTSGITYIGTATDVYVSLAGESGLTTVLATIAVVTQKLSPTDVDGQKDEENSSFPIFNYLWGDFGAALQNTSSTPSGKPQFILPPGFQMPTTQPELLGVLSQVAYNNGAGFIVDVANTTPYSGDGLPKGTRVGRLILGGAQTLYEHFPLSYTMPQPTPSTYTQLFASGATFPVYEETVTTGDAYVQPQGKAYAEASDIGLIMDTGATITTFYPGTNLGPDMAPQQGDAVVLNQTSGQTLMNFTVGNVQCQNLAKMGQGQRANGCVNTGLGLFLQFPVMFDLRSGVGAVRFPPQITLKAS
jgi:hypothetical protein